MWSSLSRLGLGVLLALGVACGGDSGGGTPAPVPPSITSQPQAATVTQGVPATFTVAASGSTPLAFQWRKDGASLPGGTGATLSIPSAQPGDAGSYSVVVSNGAGSATSAAATLTVNVPPSIMVHPQPQTVLAPAPATFTVIASGTPPLAYQWKRNGADVPGATSASYSSPAMSGADDGASFSVAVANVAGTITSSNATLTVHTAAAITVQPPSQSVVAPASATFRVTASGTPPLFYQWRRNGADLPGAIASTYVTPATSGADQGALYSAVVSNAFGNAASANAMLTVNLPPAITLQPLGQSVVAPATASFSVTATGTAPLSYQWRKNGVDLPGAVAAAYTTPATTVGDSGSLFSVAVSSPYGSVVSSAATLTVTAVPVAPAITGQPAPQTVVAPAPATFSVTATGTPPLAYQWRKGGVDIGGATGSTYTTPATNYGDNGSQFSVRVSNAAGTATSSWAALTVNAAPVITVQPADRTVTEPATATFSVGASGTPPLAYQWQRNGTNIGGATAASYTTPATAMSQSGDQFSVAVSNAFGSTLSDSATLTVNGASALDLTVPTVYITQATQTQAFDVPLVRDRNGYLRAFVIANQANTATPQVRVRIYNAASTLVQTYTIAAPGSSVPTSVNESSLANSWNVAIPSTYIQPNYQLLVDVDPTGVIAEGSETNNAWPVGGTPQTLDVRTLNPFRVTFWSVVTGDARAGNVSSGTVSTFTTLLDKIWPTNNGTDRLFGGAWTVTDTLGSSGTGWSSVLSKLSAKRTADGVSNRYYYGVVNPNYGGGVAGLGYLGWPVAIGWDKFAGYTDGGQYPGVYAHETGHNFNLNHAPCGGAGGPDPSYPYAGGLIGKWGTDLAGPTLKDPAVWSDVMGYCDTIWVSDYNYKIVLANREGGSVPIILPYAADGPPGPRSLLLWGRLDDGVPVLEPAFHLDANALPPEPGDQLLEGFDEAGGRLFSVPFSLVEVGCLPLKLARHFSFSIPVAAQDAERLAELRWTKAGELLARRGSTQKVGLGRARQEPITQALLDGRTRLLWDGAAFPLVLVMDQATGLVLGFGEGGDFRFGAEAEALEFHFSDGVRSHSTTVRRPRLEP